VIWLVLPVRNCGQALVPLPEVVTGGYGQLSVTEASAHAWVFVSKALPSIKQKLLVRSEVSGVTNGVSPAAVTPLKLNLKFREPIRFMRLMRVESLLRVDGWDELKRKSVTVELIVCSL